MGWPRSKRCLPSLTDPRDGIVGAGLDLGTLSQVTRKPDRIKLPQASEPNVRGPPFDRNARPNRYNPRPFQCYK